MRTWNDRPLRKCRKCFMERYTSSSSLSNVLYRVSAGFIFLEKEMGCQAPLMCCWRMAPTTVSEASVIRQVGASGLG